MDELFQYLEVGAFFASVFAWKKIKRVKFLRLFPFLLFVITAGEILAYYFLKLTGKGNALLYNIFITPFINVMYYCITFFALQSAGFQKAIVVFIIFYIPFALFTTFKWYDDEIHYNILSHCVGSLFLIIILIRLFYEMMVNPSELDFLKKPIFYMFFALLLFHVASLAYFSMANWFDAHNRFLNIVYDFFSSLNDILYGTYIICFIWIRMKDIY